VLARPCVTASPGAQPYYFTNGEVPDKIPGQRAFQPRQGPLI
jgi:hypothetical protein